MALARLNLDRRLTVLIDVCAHSASRIRRPLTARILALCAMLLASLATSRDARSTDLTTPSFLVATRALQDPLFEHSVILMVPSTEPPLLAGLIINTPAKQQVRDMFPEVRALKGPAESIYWAARSSLRTCRIDLPGVVGTKLRHAGLRRRLRRERPRRDCRRPQGPADHRLSALFQGRPSGCTISCWAR